MTCEDFQNLILSTALISWSRFVITIISVTFGLSLDSKMLVSQLLHFQIWPLENRKNNKGKKAERPETSREGNVRRY